MSPRPPPATSAPLRVLVIGSRVNAGAALRAWDEGLPFCAGPPRETVVEAAK